LVNIPGFVDLQVNGFLGVDFSSPDLTEEGIIYACRGLLRRGTAAFLITLITSPEQVYQHNLPLLAKVMDRKEFQGHLLGFHLEGPFISPLPGAVGSHNPEFVRNPDIGLFRKMLDWGDRRVRLLTLAAELPGADELTHFTTSQGVAVSIGHSMFTEEDLERLVKVGATALTHLGNGLPNLLPRHPNPIWAGVANDSLTAMIIADGHHLPSQVIKTCLYAKGADKTVIVSDAAPVAGLHPGSYTTLGNEAILDESGRLYNPVKQCLVGSSSTLLQCMNHLASLDIASEEEMVKMGFYNPLKLIGLESNSIPWDHNVNYDEGEYTFILGEDTNIR